jgi:hypothetical protein
MFWQGTNLDRHLAQHNGEVGSTVLLPMLLGDKSASFEVTLLVPPHPYLELHGLTVVTSASIAASSSAYWTLSLLQLDTAARITNLYDFDGSAFALSDTEPFYLPVRTSSPKALAEGRPVVLRGTKTGSPSSLTDLFVQMVLRLA